MMTRKIYSILLLVFCALGVSCSEYLLNDSTDEQTQNPDQNSDSEVYVSFSTKSISKSIVTTEDNFYFDGNKFTVNSFFVDDYTSAYIDSLDVVYSADTQSWDYEGSDSDPIIWTFSKVNMFTYYPNVLNSSTPTFSIDKGMYFENYTVADPGIESCDFLYASSVNVSKSNVTDGKINFEFQHALTQVVISAEITEGSEIQSMGISYVALGNIYSQADFSVVPVGSSYSNSTQGIWSGLRNQIYYSLYTGDNIESQGTKTYISDTTNVTLLIPQEANAWVPSTTEVTTEEVVVDDGSIYPELGTTVVEEENKITTIEVTQGAKDELPTRITTTTVQTYNPVQSSGQAYVRIGMTLTADSENTTDVYIPFTAELIMGNKLTYHITFNSVLGYDSDGKTIEVADLNIQ